jgi:hypothetical protein
LVGIIVAIIGVAIALVTLSVNLAAHWDVLSSFLSGLLRSFLNVLSGIIGR